MSSRDLSRANQTQLESGLFMEQATFKVGTGECRFTVCTLREGVSASTHTDKADSKAGRDGGQVERGQTTQDGGKLTEGLVGTVLRLLWGLVWRPDGT